MYVFQLQQKEGAAMTGCAYSGLIELCAASVLQSACFSKDRDRV